MKWHAKFLAVNVIAGLSAAAFGAGLSTAFVDVTAPDAPSGKTTEVAGPEGKGLLLKNLGDDPLHISVQALIPSMSQLKKDAAPIPSTSWIRIDPSAVEIPPHGAKPVKVYVDVPAGNQYKKRIYQVMLWSHGEAAQTRGVTLNTGLLSCLRIRTAP